MLAATRVSAQSTRPCPPSISVAGGQTATTDCAAATLKPAWIDAAVANGWRPNTWTAISGAAPSHALSATNTVASVAPPNAASLGYPAAVMDSWCGGAFASRAGAFGKFIAWGGGHADYQGNEVYGFDVGTRMWARLSDPYPSPTWPNASGWWPAHGAQVNGSPGVRHTYDLVEYHAERNSFWSFGAQTNIDGTTTPLFCEFDLTTNQWSQRALSPVAFGGAGWSCYDGRRKVFICHGAGGGSSPTVVYNPATNAFTVSDQSNSDAVSVANCAAAYDAANDIVVVMRPDTGAVCALNAAALSQSVVTLTTADKPSIGVGAGFEYCRELDGFLWYSSGAEVYLVKKDVGAWNTATWTWRQLTAAANAIIPEGTNVNGIYSRFRIARHANYVLAYTVKRTGHSGAGAMYAFMLSNTAS